MSVLKPKNIIPCTPNSWGGGPGNNPRLKDRADNDIFYPEENNPWHPIVPLNINPNIKSPTWIIYEYENPVSISDIKLSFHSGDQSDNMIVKIYKNVDTSVTTWDTSVGIYATSYSTLKTQPLDLIYEKQFTSRLELNITDALSQTQNNISNVYIEFSNATFVYEIQLLSPIISVYLKSEKSEMSLMKNIPLPYNYLMYGPNNGPRGNEPIPIRRINFENTDISFITEDQQYVKSTTYNGVTGNLILNPYKNYIGYIQDYNRKNFSLGLEYPIYKYNVYQGVTEMIKMYNSSLRSLQDNLKPWYFMMFGQWIGNGGFEQYPVWNIYFTENIITFEATYASTLRSLDFDRYTGLPIGVPKFGLYRYDGYSNITKEILNSPSINPNDYYIYGGSVGRNGNWRFLVKNIITSTNTVTFITQDVYALKGIKFDKNTGQVLGNVYSSGYTSDANTVNSLSVTPFNKDGYCIFKTNGYNNTVKPNVSNILTTNDIKNLYNDNLLSVISNDKMYHKLYLLEDVFIVTAKVTDRILVYDNNNKLIHVTDYFAKGETSKINLRYSMLNGVINVQSNIIPLYPLPTPTTQAWSDFLK